MRYIIEDTSFLVSAINPADSFHDQALELMRMMIDHDITYIFPDVVMHETTFILMKGGMNDGFIREKINSLTMLPKVIIHHNDALTSVRYMSKQYNFLVNHNRNGVSKVTKTNDYIISCNALDYNAIVITGDKQIVSCLHSNDVGCLDYTSPRASADLFSMIGSGHI